MALTRKDCLLLLADLQKRGVDTREATIEAARTPGISEYVLKFINKNRPIEVSQFYEKLRASYNNGHSSLYRFIMKSDEADPEDLIVTLSSLALQASLYAKKCEDPNMFFKMSRYDEISAVMYNYCKTFDSIPARELLGAIKADIKAFEEVIK